MPLPGVETEQQAETLALTFEGESFPSDLWLKGAIMSKQLDAKLLTIEELAIKLGCSVSTVRRAVRDEGLPAYRVSKRCVRFDWTAVSTWAKRSRRWKPFADGQGESNGEAA